MFKYNLWWLYLSFRLNVCEWCHSGAGKKDLAPMVVSRIRGTTREIEDEDLRACEAV